MKDLSQLFANKEGVDKRSAMFLIKALEANNIPGFDYLEYKQSLQVLVSMNMEESIAFKSAFATASTMGLTKQKLLDSTKHYKKVLEKEKGQFDTALKKRLEQRVKAKENENKRNIQRLQQIEAQMARLQQEMETLRAQIAKNKNAGEEERNKLAVQKRNFDNTYLSIQEDIDKDVDKINTYL